MLNTLLLGALVGLVLAFTGAGGGVLSIPLLVLVLHRPMAEAAPVGLLAVGLAAAFGAAVGIAVSRVGGARGSAVVRRSREDAAVIAAARAGQEHHRDHQQEDSLHRDPFIVESSATTVA